MAHFCATVPAVLEAADTVFLDSEAALVAAQGAGLRPQCRVLTCSPGLVLSGQALSLEAGVSDGDIHLLGKLIGQIGARIHDLVGDHSSMSKRTITLARVATRQENFAYKAMLLDRADLGKAIVVVEPANAISSGHVWHTFLDGETSYLGKVRVEIDLPDTDINPPEQVPSLLARLNFEPPASVLYRLASSVPLFAKQYLSPAGTILIASENSLIKEMGCELARQGYRLRRLQPLTTGGEFVALPMEIEDGIRGIVAETLESFISAQWLRERVAANFIKHCRVALCDFKSAKAQWPKAIETGAAVLTNSNVNSVGEALCESCIEAGIPHFAVQHGMATETSSLFTANAPFGMEAAGSEHFISYNSRLLEHIRGSRFNCARLHSAGMPQDLRNMARTRRGFGPRTDICYVSTQAFFSDVMQPSASGISDLESATWETGVVEKVLSQLPHRVLYKPFRTVRYLDENPMHRAAANAAGVDVYWPRLDLRYIVSGARVVVVAHAASTLSWCLMSDKPLVYLHSRGQAPLHDDFEEQLRRSVIFVDADDPAFWHQLKDCLSRPIAEIEAEWAEMASARRRLVERYIGLTDGLAGKRGAAAITAAILDRKVASRANVLSAQG